MADRIQNIVRRFQSSAGGQEEEIQRAHGVVNKRPRLSDSESQSQTQLGLQSQRPIQPRSRSSRMVDEEERAISVQDVESGSESGSEEFETEDSDGVAEGQREQPHATASTPALLQQGQANPDGGLRSCSAVAAASNTGSRAIPVMLTDLAALDCPTCHDPLCAPIYQCENEHIACTCCFNKAMRRCPSCTTITSIQRCRAMERLVESVGVECNNKWLGCKETVIYSRKADHEEICPHTPCICPQSSCAYVASFQNLYAHFKNHHAATCFAFDTPFSLSVERSQKQVILQERDEGVIFILNHDDIEGRGRVLDVECIGPSTFVGAFVYQVSVKCMDTSLSIESVAEVCRKWRQHTPSNNCLTVPSDLPLSNGRFSMQVCIRQPHPVQ